ncbi:MAG: tetratricopeptide repeat protein [Candidatus Odinarchaeota archaeon]
MVEDIKFKEYKDDIESLFDPKRKYTFLVGAGISMDRPTNMPSAIQIVKGLLELCAPQEEIGNLLSLDMLRYELVVEKIQNIFDEDLKFLDYLESVTEPNLIHMFLANSIARGNYVITTNFDYLIEQALLRVLDEQWHQDILPIISKEDYIFYQDPDNLVKSNKYPIFKIHGSKRNIITGKDTKDSLITTMSALGKERGEGETFTIEPYKKPTVFNLMNNRSLIVLGYSGSDDFDIGPTLMELPYLNRLIWIEHSQNTYPEIIKIRKRKDLNSQEQISSLENILTEISSSGDYEVVLVRVHTSKFIETYLWKIFLPYHSLNETILGGSDKEIPNFLEWIKPLYENVSKVEKYKFACQLFYFLKEIEAASRCSQKGIQNAEEVNDISSKSYFLNFLGLITQIKGSYANALEYYQNALGIDQSLNDLAGIGSDINNIGSIYLTIGKYDEALEQYQQALEIAEELDDKGSNITCLNNLGRVYEVRHEFDLALEKYLEGIKITEEVGDLNSKALLLNNIGMIYRAKEENERAIKYFDESVQISDLLGDVYGKIIVLNNIGRVYDESKDYEKALEKYNESIKFADQLGDLAKKAGSMNNIGSIYLAQGNTDKALEIYQEALNIEERLGDPLMKIIYLNNIGMIHNSRGNYDIAKQKYKEALIIANNISDLSKKALLLTKIASINMNKEDHQTALDQFEEAVLIFENIGELSNKAATLSNIGKIYETFNNYYEALRRYEETLKIDQQLQDPMGIASDLYNLGRVYSMHGEYRKALQNYEESQKIFNQLEQKQYVDIIRSKIDEIQKNIGK